MVGLLQVYIVALHNMVYWAAQPLGWIVGVTKAGPVSAGTFSTIQSKMGSVAAGGIMAGVQSVVMGGVGTTALTMTVVAATTLAAAATAPGQVACCAVMKAIVGR